MGEQSQIHGKNVKGYCSCRYVTCKKNPQRCRCCSHADKMRESKKSDREARAAAYLNKAKERKTAPKTAAISQEVAICVAHGLPECAICRKLEIRDRNRPQQLQYTEVENTSLQIGAPLASSRNPSSSRPPTRGSAGGGGASRAPLSEIEQKLQVKLFRNQRAAIEDACRKADQTSTGYLSREEFGNMLGGLMLHPGEREFAMLWQQYVPSGVSVPQLSPHSIHHIDFHQHSTR